MVQLMKALTASEIETKDRLIDNNHFQLSVREAILLCRVNDAHLPKTGYERKVELSTGEVYWIKVTKLMRGTVWCAHRANPTVVLPT